MPCFTKLVLKTFERFQIAEPIDSICMRFKFTEVVRGKDSKDGKSARKIKSVHEVDDQDGLDRLLASIDTENNQKTFRVEVITFKPITSLLN